MPNDANASVASRAQDEGCASPTAFTLVELLVVIALIAIAMGITLPTMSAMVRDSDRNTGTNAVTMAGTVARAYATRPIADVKDVNLRTTTTPSQPNASDEPGSYSGCIALFTPANEIRIAENGIEAQRARADTTSGSLPSALNAGQMSYLERLYWTGSSLAASDWGEAQNPKHLNGFRDLQIDYIHLPGDIAVAGVIRNEGSTANQPPRLLAPPFAVWFDANGTLVAASNEAPSDFVYYDGDGNKGYDINTVRSPNYNPDVFDPRAPGYDPNNYDTAVGAKRYKLPFDRIEAVAAVMVYSKSVFRSEATAGGFYWDDGTSTALDQKRWDWMKENGQMVLFTRQNGLALRGLLEY